MDEAMIVSLKSIRLNRKTEKDVIVDAVAVSEQFCILGYHNPTQSNWKPTRWTATGHCMDNSPISDLDMNDPALAGVAVIVGKFHQRPESAKDARDSLVRLRPQHFQTASRHAAKITALLLSEQFCMIGFYNPGTVGWQPTRWNAVGGCLDHSPAEDFDTDTPALEGIIKIIRAFD